MAHLYPDPTHDTIIEPFAGGASYSARHYMKRVLLYDSDPITASIWNFLLSPNALQDCEQLIPNIAYPGDLVTALMPEGTPEGLIRLLQAEANVGTQGARGVHNQVTKFGAKSWARIKPKMRHWLPRIRHWRFHHLPFTEIPNQNATWFVDPPYNNPAGARYREQIKDYYALGDWCKSRRGQLIVCENNGANWLPFEPLVPRRGVKSRYQKSEAMEALYTHENS